MSLPASPPSDLPRWADGTHGHAASVTEPTELKKDTGWVGSSAPPAAEMNWLQNLAYQWLDWINDALTELQDTKVEVDEDIEFTDDTHFIGDSTNRVTIFAKGVSLGAGGTETLSAHRVFGNWVPNAAGRDLGAAGLEWDAFIRSIVFDGVNPAFNVAQKDQLSKVNMCKAWATLDTDGLGNVTVVDGFNIDDALTVISGADIVVTFAQAFADTKFSPVVSQSKSGVTLYLPGAGARTTTSFKISSNENFSSASGNRLSVHVYGRQ